MAVRASEAANGERRYNSGGQNEIVFRMDATFGLAGRCGWNCSHPVCPIAFVFRFYCISLELSNINQFSD